MPSWNFHTKRFRFLTKPFAQLEFCDSFVDDGTPLDYGPAAVTTIMPRERKMPALSRSRVHDLHCTSIIKYHQYFLDIWL
jgi:hypothetical protein